MDAVPLVIFTTIPLLVGILCGGGSTILSASSLTLPWFADGMADIHKRFVRHVGRVGQHANLQSRADTVSLDWRQHGSRFSDELEIGARRDTASLSLMAEGRLPDDPERHAGMWAIPFSRAASRGG